MATTRDKVLEMTLRGLTPREIAILLQVTTQNVHYHLDKLREVGELPEPEEASA